GFGQGQGAMATLIQRHSEAMFQLLDLTADRRLRQEQLVARLGEAQKPGRSFKRMQQIQPQLARPRRLRPGRSSRSNWLRIPWLHGLHVKSAFVIEATA